MKDIYANTNDYDLEAEVWRPIEGFEKYYEISSHGRVKSLMFFHNSRWGKGVTLIPREKIRKLVSNKSGYLYVTINLDGKVYGKSVHRLVAKAFISNPENKKEVNHINGIKHDNRVSNLEWCTPQENSQDALIRGAKKLVLNPEKVSEIRELKEMGLHNSQIALVTGLSVKRVYKVVNKENWKFVK